ncbi:MAG: hypothetical protein UR82_C0044G0010 [Candidatus Moranbacteria bacterium GW2011_GWF1_35_5]|nr:MAG: hypothetical protein UR82_C0044G0010 [Candidatus Moranbacteria bacterium GW2011_GWF1_35_5]
MLLAIISFCKITTRLSSISIPKSPLATITPSVSFKISSKLSIASFLSILAIILGCVEASFIFLAINFRKFLRFSPFFTKEIATKSTSFSKENSKSFLSLGVIISISKSAPGILTPLWFFIVPPSITLVSKYFPLFLATFSFIKPSSIKISCSFFKTLTIFFLSKKIKGLLFLSFTISPTS